MTKGSQTQTQHQEQLLTQTLSPQQLLAVQLLEMTAVEIEERVRSEVMDNPALEPLEHDEVSSDEAVQGSDASEDFDDYSGNEEIPVARGYSGGNHDYPIGDSISFGDTLMEQLGELSLSPLQQTAGEYIIGSLDEDGLLRKPLAEIADELFIYNNIDISVDALLELLKMIQTFEPAGIAARTLQECLLLQLERNSGQRDMSVQKRIVTDYYDDFTGKRWVQMAEKMGISAEECREAIADIVRLNPRPGASLSESLGYSRQQITPDFLLDVQDEEVYVSMNNAHVPVLRVSEEYVQMLNEQSNSTNSSQRAAAQFLRQKIDAAKNFVGAVQQRERTMLSTMRAIVKVQKSFFLSGGDEATLKPMILEDISRITGYDISTISRVGNSKYVQTPWSIYPLKYFFSDGVVKDDGTEQSVYELFRVLRELINEEDKQYPLTDQALQELLAERGYSIARRTIAKYREQLGIPVARLRKE